MLKNNEFKFILCLFFLVLSNSAKAQATHNTLPLIAYLQQLEQQFTVKFSYINTSIENISIVPSKSKKIEDILNHIKKETDITFAKLSDRYYAVTTKKYARVCGTILDNFQQNTIIGASVEVLGDNQSTITNTNGSFTLKNITKDAVIRVRFIGFKTLYIRASELSTNVPCPYFLMDQHYEELDEITISQFLTTGLTKNLDGSIVLNTENFGILPGLIEPDVLQTAQALPGIKSINETVSNINVRGGTNDQNLILWEGIKMYQSGHFFGLISAFNPYLTNKVTITKNGTSSQFGDGISSVIDMRTNNEITEGFTGGAGFTMISADVFGQLPINKKTAFQFSVRRSVTDFLNSPTYTMFFDKAFQDSEIENKSSSTEITRNEDFYFYDFSAKILYDINESQKLRISFIQMNNALDYQETVDDKTSLSTLDQRNTSFGGSLESNWSSNFSTLFNAYRTFYNLNASSVSSDPNQQLEQINKVLENGIKLNTRYKLSKSLYWLNGYQLVETGIINFTNVTQPPYRKNIKGVIRTNAIYSELDFQTKSLKAKGGLRINHIENINTFKKWIVEPRVNINYKLAKNINTELLGEFKSQSTNQIIDLEQNFLGVEKRRWILANEDNLPITTSKQASLGFTYNHNRLYVGIEGFYKDVKGISTLTQGFQNEDQFDGEIGKYNVKGVEFLINKKTSSYSTWLSYTYNLNNYTFKTITPPTFPNNLDITHHITFAGTYNYKKIKLGVGINYHTGKPYTEPKEGNNALDLLVFPNSINYKDPNSSRLPYYLRTDVSALYNFRISKNTKATIGASVLNILNKKNVLNRYYRVSPENEIETVESISLGSTPNISFRLRF
ncbi:TonB-dependent receptor [Cellulophaga sp. F20128]|uniref:TonB-dependent receptor n=1 Tax=Cellulophaga sp. F20128 TaxID=2926413 RepID=UPI001FF5726A|nr:carboxypeptidase-like regulatory domain-containing protein [Cellulophaga sp. F20128]MCK0156247.1 TonB-dependent receptor [Cellulophaga sp. F20128]